MSESIIISVKQQTGDILTLISGIKLNMMCPDFPQLDLSNMTVDGRSYLMQLPPPLKKGGSAFTGSTPKG